MSYLFYIHTYTFMFGNLFFCLIILASLEPLLEILCKAVKENRKYLSLVTDYSSKIYIYPFIDLSHCYIDPSDHWCFWAAEVSEVA